MVFSSIVFLFAFLTSVLAVYYAGFRLPMVYRNGILLCFSLLFYYWGSRNYFILLLASILGNYVFGLLIGRSRRLGFRRLFLVMGVASNLSLLFVFKYADFFLENVSLLLHRPMEPLELVLPIGISFFTFQGLSYVIDVYTGKAKVNGNPFHIALYISLFPQLVAGPIVKYNEVCDQIRRRFVTLSSFSNGLWRFVIGLSKKALIANVLGETADSIFDLVGPSGVDAPTAWLGVLCYALQIYFDFSGYSDMAIGLGKLFGFEFLENFNHPYISSSLTEFWRRWHISLSTWFRDYLYIPLGGNRKGNASLHLFIVFLATGLWHGASWNFVLWGVWHGAFLILEKPLMKREWYRKTPRLLRYMGTMSIVLFGWVLFRSPDLFSTLEYVKAMFGAAGFENLTFTFAYFMNPRIGFTLLVAILASGAYLGLRPRSLRWTEAEKQEESLYAALGKMVAIACLFALCIMYIVNGAYNPFIYFRF